MRKLHHKVRLQHYVYHLINRTAHQLTTNHTPCSTAGGADAMAADADWDGRGRGRTRSGSPDGSPGGRGRTPPGLKSPTRTSVGCGPEVVDQGHFENVTSLTPLLRSTPHIPHLTSHTPPPTLHLATSGCVRVSHVETAPRATEQ